MGRYRSAWDKLYAGDSRPWRGADPADASPFPAGTLVLEIGCGNGKTASSMVSRGIRVVCCDYSQEAIKACKSNVPGAEDWVVADARSLPFPDSTFDGVSLIHVLEHLLDDATVAVTEAFRVLKPGGLLHARSFSDNDMRAEKGVLVDGFRVRGNGIGYVYRSIAEFAGLFPNATEGDVSVTRKKTRFGEVRETFSIVISKAPIF